MYFKVVSINNQNKNWYKYQYKYKFGYLNLFNDK
jgi:hypothetical protein